MIKSLFFRTGTGRRAGRISDYLVTLAIFALVALIVAHVDRFEGPPLAGTATIADGDTIVIAGERVRLKGIDAPEYDQICKREGADYACGKAARNYLRQLIGNRGVSCSGSERDRYDRLLGTCLAGDTDLNRAMVEAGWAVAFGDYHAEETLARRDRMGLWAGRFDRPQSWRSAHGRSQEDVRDLFGTVRTWLRRFFGLPDTADTGVENGQGEQDETL